jgi:alkaline phosphatase D
LCLGDYVYETGYADRVYIPGRDDPIQQAVTQDQFRAKYRMYRSDPDLQAVHAAYPMINVFDNHDGLAAPGDNQATGAIAAFFEHLPVRSRLPGRIDRSLRWGDLAEIFMTDQRSFRDQTLEEEGPLGTSTTERPEILDPNRTMLGAEQRNWLLNGLSGSSAQWKVIGSQLMFWPWRSFGRLPGQPRGSGVYLNLTQWDGYVAERLAILDHLEQNNVRNTLLFSGDSHVFSAAQIAPDVDDPRSVPRIAEFGTGSVTSNNADENNYPSDDVTRPYLRSVNPNHLRFFESERHGYAAAEITPSGTSVEFRSPRTIRQPTSATQILSRMRVATDTQRVELLAP